MKCFFLPDALNITLHIDDNDDDDDDDDDHDNNNNNNNKSYSMLTRKKQWTTVQETQAFSPSAVY